MHAEEQQKMGERVAFYQQALERLGEARKLAKYIEPVQVSNCRSGNPFYCNSTNITDMDLDWG